MLRLVGVVNVKAWIKFHVEGEATVRGVTGFRLSVHCTTITTSTT